MISSIDSLKPRQSRRQRKHTGMDCNRWKLLEVMLEDNYQTECGNQNFVPAIVSINYQFGTPGKRASEMNFIH